MVEALHAKHVKFGSVSASGFMTVGGKLFVVSLFIVVCVIKFDCN